MISLLASSIFASKFLIFSSSLQKFLICVFHGCHELAPVVDQRTDATMALSTGLSASKNLVGTLHVAELFGKPKCPEVSIYGIP